jgi:hypothetical protein
MREVLTPSTDWTPERVQLHEQRDSDHNTAHCRHARTIGTVTDVGRTPILGQCAAIEFGLDGCRSEAIYWPDSLNVSMIWRYKRSVTTAWRLKP